MKPVRYLQTLFQGMVAVSLFLALPAWSGGAEPVMRAPEDIHFSSDASRPGHMAVATLYGDMARSGLYAARVLIPAGLKVMPHTHPDDRVVVVLSGTLHVGFGDRFDASPMQALPAGSFFTEPAGRAHFAWARDGDVIVQVSGIGPSGTTYFQPKD
jgi:quercetin dioxygenase-like cupin family protein